jgi:TPR repeat protein
MQISLAHQLILLLAGLTQEVLRKRELSHGNTHMETNMDIQKKCALDAFDASNYEQALSLMLPIAEAGDIEIMCNVGTIYQLGLGVPRNLEKAVYWLEKAALQGNALAAHNLGTLYMTCLPDWPQDPELSEKWRALSRKLGGMPFSVD